MPNWCYNTITINHSNPEMMNKFKDIVNDDTGLLQSFIPCPEELLDDEQQENHNIETYGYKTWYDWRIANWGVKWDITLEYPTENDDGSITVSFDSAWNPPIKAYEKLQELGFSIVAYYAEPGMRFAGKWDNGDDEYYNDAKDASQELQDMFDIPSWDDE